MRLEMLTYLDSLDKGIIALELIVSELTQTAELPADPVASDIMITLVRRHRVKILEMQGQFAALRAVYAKRYHREAPGSRVTTGSMVRWSGCGTCASPSRVAFKHGERRMSDEPKTGDTQDLAAVEYDGERRARVGAGQAADPKKAAPMVEEAPEVGLSQKGTDEDAIVRRETDV